MACSYAGDKDLKEKLLQSIEQKFNKEPLSDSECWTIYNVPQRPRRLNEVAYNPLTVSIGPLHWGKKELPKMEAHKIKYMESLIQRASETTIPDCGDIILNLEEKARNCYAENIIRYDKTKLAEILLVDGCFILELFLRYSIKDKDPDHLIFGSPGMLSAVQIDLLLLENQIPFFVLEDLFNTVVVKCFPDRTPPHTLSQYAFRFFKSVLHFNKEAVKKTYSSSEGVIHLLDLAHKFCQPIKHGDPEHNRSLPNIPSATKLGDAGIVVELRNSEDSHGLFDIDFTAGGVLKIPCLCADDMTEPLFRNLIAYEQFCGGTKQQYFTSYAMLMDGLIDTPQDVELLQQAEIITNDLGDSEDVSKLFNNLCKEVSQKEGEMIFSGIIEEVDYYCKNWWPKTRAHIKRNYFSNPVKFAAFAIAFVALILTILQTVYAIATYYYTL